MTSNPSRLKLNRLVIRNNTSIIYDEEFHYGINIIRGEHSVGKSTILDLIFYVLGGELKKEEWKEPANRCSFVTAEVLINKSPITLSRPIDAEGKIPHTYVYDGPYELAIKDASGWKDFGPRRGEDKLSFSEMIFEMFNWGQFKSSENTNLTMHQILRLLYLSQTSDANRIFRKETNLSFDSENNRLAVAEFLLGLDDLEAYSYRQQLIKLLKEDELTGVELRTYIGILGEQSSITEQEIKEKIDISNGLIDSIDREIINTIQCDDVIDDDILNVNAERKIILESINDLTFKIENINSNTVSLKTEIQDCVLFEQSLDFRIKSLNESRSAYENIGTVSFDYCPSCFSPVETEESQPNCCKLCKSEPNTNSLKDKYLSTLSELQYQKRQNKKIIEKLSLKINQSDDENNALQIELDKLQHQLFKISTASSSRELKLSELEKKRALQLIEIERLKEKAKLAKKMDEIKFRKKKLGELIADKKVNIELLDEKNRVRRENVHAALLSISKELLEKDSGNEENFKKAKSLNGEVDFSKDRWLLDERVNYSESSNVVKKSVFHLAMLLFSLIDNECRYPRFSIMDFECADINEERSRNLQRLIAITLAPYSDYQLIMTTSKIDPSLNIESLGVGRYYDKNDYILKI